MLAVSDIAAGCDDVMECSLLAHSLKNPLNMTEGNYGLSPYATANKLHRTRYQSNLSSTVENISNLEQNQNK